MLYQPQEFLRVLAAEIEARSHKQSNRGGLAIYAAQDMFPGLGSYTACEAFYRAGTLLDAMALRWHDTHK